MVIPQSNRFLIRCLTDLHCILVDRHHTDMEAMRACMKAIRLDVNAKNTPAIRLYESLGFSYIATVDLGYGIEKTEWYRLYQLLL